MADDHGVAGSSIAAGAGDELAPDASTHELDYDDALRAEIDRKKAEIIQGFPFVSLGGVGDVVSHLSTLQPLPFSNFPYSSTVPADNTFASFPEFEQYAAEMDALFNADLDSQGNVKPEDADVFASATKAIQDALREHGQDLDQIPWQSSPYGLRGLQEVPEPYAPARPRKLKKHNAHNVNSLADAVLNASGAPYPSPKPYSATPGQPFVPTLGAMPPRISGREGEPGEPPAEALRVANESREFLKKYVREQVAEAEKEAQAAESKGKGKDSARHAPSPISMRFMSPPTAASSSRTSTAAKPVFQQSADQPVASTSRSVSPSINMASTKPAARTHKAPPFSPLRGKEHLYPSPLSQASSSPDPLLIREASHKKLPSHSGLVPVVEVSSSAQKRHVDRGSSTPTSPRKKRAIANPKGKPASRHAVSSSKHGPFSDYTSEMDVDDGQVISSDEDASGDSDDVVAVASSPAIASKKGKASRVAKQEVREERMRASSEVVEEEEEEEEEIKLVAASKPASKRSRSRVVEPASKADQDLLEKFADLIQEIVDAEHALLRGIGMGDDSDDEAKADIDKYFVASELTGRNTALQPATIKRITKYVTKLVKSSNGRRLFEEAMFREEAESGKKADKQRQREDSDLVAQLQSVLRLLERSIAPVEVLKVIPVLAKGEEKESAAITPRKKAGTKAKGGKRVSESPSVSASSSPVKPRRRSSRSRTPHDYTDEEDEEEHSDSEAGESEEETPKKAGGRTSGKKSAKISKGRKGVAAKRSTQDDDAASYRWTSEAVGQLAGNLKILHTAMLAIDASMAVLTGGRLSKKLYSEDLVNTCLKVLKTQLPAVIYPALDAANSTLAIPLSDEDVLLSIRNLLQALPTVISRFSALIRQEEMPEAIVINGVYVAIAPFFVEQGLKSKAKDTAFGVAEMKSIRNEALTLIRTIFAKYPDQRQWIVEEVLTSITKLPDIAKRKPQYILSNGEAIQTVSLLLLHLVQSCCSGALETVQAALRALHGDGSEELGEEADAIMVIHRVVEPALTSTTRCGKAIISYLLHRSGKAPKNSTASEAEYRAVLDHLIRDLLTLVNLPEWPVANYVLWLTISNMITILDNTSSSADVNAAKGISLEHLGLMGAQIYRLSAVPSGQPAAQPSDLKSLRQIVEEQTKSGLRALGQAEAKVTQGLLLAKTEDRAIETALDYALVNWSNDLHAASRRLATLAQVDVKPKFAIELSSLQTSVWDVHQPDGPFQDSLAEERLDLEKTVQHLFAVRGLPSCKSTILEHILDASDGAIIAFRQKALKALAAIVEHDSSIFFQSKTQRAVENRLRDKSPLVRDAAVELLGRYVVYDSDLATRYLDEIRSRIKDSGLSVRKRVIKLLKAIFPTVGHDARVRICKSLITRLQDEDANVKEMAVSALAELLFGSKTPSSKTKAAQSDKEFSPAKKAEILADSAVLRAVVGALPQTPHPLEAFIGLCFEKSESKSAPRDRASLMNAIRAIIETLVDALIDPDKRSELDVASAIRTIQVLLLADASMLKINRANLLLPELKSAMTTEEKVVQEHLLKIFASILPHMDSSASTFARGLQQTCTSLLNTPLLLSERALAEVVACFCAVVIQQTSDYAGLCRVFQKFLKLLGDNIKRLLDTEKAPAQVERATSLRHLPVLARTVSLFCQHGDFDRLRQHSPDANLVLSAICTDSIQKHVYEQMLDLYRLSAGSPLHITALECLGFIYRATPQYMEDDRSTKLMLAIFASTSIKAKATLLDIIADLLALHSAKSGEDDKTDEDGAVDLKQLVGNNETFADSGVSTGIVQRYLPYILEAAMTPVDVEGNKGDKQILLRPALQAISFTVKQGLANPMQSLPVLVALETSEDATVAKKAYLLHSNLHNKHSNLVNMRIADSIKMSFDYQLRAQSTRDLRGYRGDPPVALLHHWYYLMREKRQWRLDYLKALLRGLQIDIAPGSTCTQRQVDFARYTAENVATLEYRSQEEVFYVIRMLTDVLSVSGMQVYHQLQAGEDERLDEASSGGSPEEALTLDLARKSLVMCVVYCLRSHLRSLYGVTDQKMAKYQVGKKSAAGDKPVTAKADAALFIEYDGLPSPVVPLHEKDIGTQKEAYINMIDSDGTIRDCEPLDEDMSS